MLDLLDQGRWSFQCLLIRCTKLISEKRAATFRTLVPPFSTFFRLSGSKLLFNNNHFWIRNVRHCVCLGAFTWTTHYLSRFASCRKRADQGLLRDKPVSNNIWSPVIKPKCFRMKCWTSICCGSKWIVEIWAIWISDVSSKSLWSLVNIAKSIDPWVFWVDRLGEPRPRKPENLLLDQHGQLKLTVSRTGWHPTKTSRRGVASKISAGSVKLAKMNKPSCCLMKGLWF